MSKIKSKPTALNIWITVLMAFLGIYRCFTYPIEALLSGRSSFEYVENYFFDGFLSSIVSNILNLNFIVCGLIIFALFSKKATKVLLLIANCLLWIKSSIYLFGERLDVGLRGGTTDFFDFMYIRFNGYFYLSLFIIILCVYILEKRKKNVPYYLRFSVVVPFVLLITVLILRMFHWEEPSTYINMIDDRVVLYFSDSKAKVQEVFFLFTNVVNKTVEVIRCISFTLLLTKILNFFPKNNN